MKNLNQLLTKIIFILVIIAGVKFFYDYKASSKQQRSSKDLYSHLGGDFTLHTHDKKGDKKGSKEKFTLKDLKGKPSILYFGFTSCPDICPIALSRLNRAIDKIDPKLHNQIHKVFISVDYKRDTPERVDEYAKHFGNFIGLTGNKEEIEAMTKAYAVHFEFVELKDSAMKYTVDHTSRFYLLDRQGKIVNSFSDLDETSGFKENLQETLKESL